MTADTLFTGARVIDPESGLDDVRQVVETAVGGVTAGYSLRGRRPRLKAPASRMALTTAKAADTFLKLFFMFPPLVLVSEATDQGMERFGCR